jgi:transcriptional regulator with XRE-family HTH domain
MPLEYKAQVVKARENTCGGMMRNNESIRTVAKVSGRSPRVIDHFLNGKYRHPDIHLLYNIAGHYGHDIKTFTSTPANKILDAEKSVNNFEPKTLAELGETFSRNFKKRLSVMGVDKSFVARRIRAKLALSKIGNLGFIAADKAVNLLGFTLDQFITSRNLPTPNSALSQNILRLNTRRALIALSIITNAYTTQPLSAFAKNHTTHSIMNRGHAKVTMNSRQLQTQHYKNFVDNMKRMIDKKRVSYDNLEKAARLSKGTIKNLVKGFYTNPDSYLIYRISHYFNYDMDTFLNNTPDELERINPSLSPLEKALSKNQFQQTYTDHILSRAKQLNVSITELADKAGIPLLNSAELGKLNINELQSISKYLNTRLQVLISAPRETGLLSSPQNMTPNVNTASNSLMTTTVSKSDSVLTNKMELNNFRDNLVILAKKKGFTLEALAREVKYPPTNLFRLVNGSISSINLELMFRTAELFNVEMDALTRPMSQDLLDSITTTNSTKYEGDIFHNYRENTEYNIRRHNIFPSDLAARLGYNNEKYRIGKDYFIARDLANSFGYELKTYLTNAVETLPQPNADMIREVLKRFDARKVTDTKNKKLTVACTDGISKSKKIMRDPVIRATEPVTAPSVESTLSPHAISRNIRENIRFRMKDKMIFVKELSIRSGVPEKVIRDIVLHVLDNPNSYDVYRLAHALGDDMHTFISNSPKQLAGIPSTIPPTQVPLTQFEFKMVVRENILVRHLELNRTVPRNVKFVEKADFTVAKLQRISTRLAEPMESILRISNEQKPIVQAVLDLKAQNLDNFKEEFNRLLQNKELQKSHPNKLTISTNQFQHLYRLSSKELNAIPEIHSYTAKDVTIHHSSNAQRPQRSSTVNVESSPSMVMNVKNSVTGLVKSVSHSNAGKLLFKAGNAVINEAFMLKEGLGTFVKGAAPLVVVEMMARFVADDLEIQRSLLMSNRNPLGTSGKAFEVLGITTKQILLDLGLVPLDVLNKTLSQTYHHAVYQPIDFSKQTQLTPVQKEIGAVIQQLGLPFVLAMGAREGLQVGIQEGWAKYKAHADSWNASFFSLLTQIGGKIVKNAEKLARDNVNFVTLRKKVTKNDITGPKGLFMSADPDAFLPSDRAELSVGMQILRQQKVEQVDKTATAEPPKSKESVESLNKKRFLQAVRKDIAKNKSAENKGKEEVKLTTKQGNKSTSSHEQLLKSMQANEKNLHAQLMLKKQENLAKDLKINQGFSLGNVRNLQNSPIQDPLKGMTSKLGMFNPSLSTMPGPAQDGPKIVVINLPPRPEIKVIPLPPLPGVKHDPDSYNFTFNNRRK